MYHAASIFKYIMEPNLFKQLQRGRKTGQVQIQNKKLTCLPAELCNMSNESYDMNWWECVPFKKLDLCNNEIPVIPAELSKEQDLEVIRLSSNKLTEVSALFELSLIKTLDLRHNLIKCLPESVNQAGTLVELLLNHNQLSSMPPMDGLSHLEILNLSNNHLQSVNLTGASLLKQLDLSHNRIQVIQRDSLRGLTQLMQLHLNNNHLT